MFRKMEGQTGGLLPQGITSYLGEKFHPWGPTSILEAQSSPYGRNKKQASVASCKKMVIKQGRREVRAACRNTWTRSCLSCKTLQNLSKLEFWSANIPSGNPVEEEEEEEKKKFAMFVSTSQFLTVKLLTQKCEHWQTVPFS
jgi:hypothetical protein